jgi:hypothetical protein
MKETILKFLKTYPQRPYYTLRLQLQACRCNLYLNGIPIISFYARGGVTTEVPLNNFILKSGRQQLQLTMLPLDGETVLNTYLDCSAEIGRREATSGRQLENYQRINSFKVEEATKQGALPRFMKELPFVAEVPWDYSATLAGAQNLPEGKVLEALVRNAVYNIHNLLEQRSTSKYQALVTPSIAKESDVLYRTPEEIEALVEHADLSRVVSVLPVPPFHVQTYCNNKLVKALRDTPDDWGNQSVLTYKVPSLSPGGKEGIARQDWVFYLPVGARELQIY